MKPILIFAGISGFLSVALGAFGAHALRDRLGEYFMARLHTGIQYQMFHTLMLGIVGVLLSKFPKESALKWSARCFMFGIIVFSGSLYALALTFEKRWGMITPIGGVAFLVGWALFTFGITHVER